MDIARPSLRSVRADLSLVLPPSAQARSTSPLPPATQSTSEGRMLPFLQAPAAALAMPIEEQARTLLAAVARPDDTIADADAVIDYIMHLLAHTNVLSELVVELVRDGALDRDLRHILGALFGLNGVPFFSQSSQLKQVEAALAHVEGWHTKLRGKGEQVLELDVSSQARCPISHKAWPELDFPVAVDVGAIACVFEAESILKWMQVSMQTPGRQGVAVNPLDRSRLHLEQLKAVSWAQQQHAKI